MRIIRLLRKVIKRTWLKIKAYYSSKVIIQGVNLYLDKGILSSNLKRRLILGNYEVNETKIISKYLSTEDVVLELGTGIGFISLYCSSICSAKNVHSYEANPLLIPLIMKNYELNDRGPVVENSILINNPISAFSDFFVCKDFYSSSLTRPREFEKVIAVPNKDFLTELQRIKPTFLIVDIEGFEYELFRGVELPPQITKVLIELHPNKAYVDYDLLSHFEKIGFVIEKYYLQVNQLFATRA